MGWATLRLVPRESSVHHWARSVGAVNRRSHGAPTEDPFGSVSPWLRFLVEVLLRLSDVIVRDGNCRRWHRRHSTNPKVVNPPVAGQSWHVLSPKRGPAYTISYFHDIVKRKFIYKKRAGCPFAPNPFASHHSS